MGQHWSLFRHGDSSFGLFYPKGYTLAAFTDMEHALAAENDLKRAGIPAEDVRAVSGEFVAGRLESPEDRTLRERFKVHVAEALGTEEVFVEQDLAFAHEGGAFLFVHTPDDATTARVKELLERNRPEYARRYGGMAIERLYEDGRQVGIRGELGAR